MIAVMKLLKSLINYIILSGSGRGVETGALYSMGVSPNIGNEVSIFLAYHE